MENKSYKQLFRNIKCLLFDIDGVLTNGTLIVMPDELYRTMNIRDGYALKAAVESGLYVAIISGGKSESVRTRLSNLGIKDIFLGVTDKTAVLNEIMEKNNFSKEEILYMGDDMPDYYVMQHVGFPCCPADAAPEIKELSVYISHAKGGEGCVRDVIEQLMKIKETWLIVKSIKL